MARMRRAGGVTQSAQGNGCYAQYTGPRKTRDERRNECGDVPATRYRCAGPRRQNMMALKSATEVTASRRTRGRSRIHLPAERLVPL